MTGPVFPAAAPSGDDRHPHGCACLECIDALLAEMSKPLVIPRPRRDPALADRKETAYTDWLATRPPAYVIDGPDANRATRGPGTGGGAGRRPSGPGRRRGAGGGKSSSGGCLRVLVALAAAVVLLWGLAGFAYLFWPFAAR